MRKAITFMQTGQRLHSTQTPPTPITTESSMSIPQDMRSSADEVSLAVYEIAGVVPQSIVDALMTSVGIDVRSGLINSLRGQDGFQMVRETVTMINRQGYSAGQVLQQVSLSSQVFGALH
jgi:replication factor C subunit 2/4